MCVQVEKVREKTSDNNQCENARGSIGKRMNPFWAKAPKRHKKMEIKKTK